MNRRSRKALIVTMLLGALTVTYTASASTFFIPDGDTSALLQLLVNGMQQLNTLNEQLGTLRRTYSETKKLAGYAEDAVAAFRGIAHTPTSLEPCSYSKTLFRTCATSTARRTI